MQWNNQCSIGFEFYLCDMRKKHLIVAGITLLMSMIAAYFGVRVQNANANFLLTELNELDRIYYADIEEVPRINFMAAIVTAPLLLSILVLEFLILRKAAIIQVRNIAIGLTVAVLAVIVVDVMIILQPAKMDFSKWGYVWICMGLFLIVGNVLSVFIERFSKQ